MEEISNINRFFQDWNYFAIFYKDDDKGISIKHMVGYKEYPSKKDVEYNRQELIDDKDFGLGEEAKELKVRILDQEWTRLIFSEQE